MKPIKYLLLLITAITMFLSCGNSEKTTSVESNEDNSELIAISKEQFEQNNMTLGNLEKKQMPLTINVNGMIDVPPENRAMVNAIKGGYIKTAPLLIGDVVKKGQRLVTIENPEFVNIQQKYLEVKGQLDFLKAEYERQKIMLNENITSKKNFLSAESNFKTAMAKYNGLHKELTLLNISPTNVDNGNLSSIVSIYAPISGSITKVNVSIGSYVSPATVIMEIVDNDHVHVELSVFEKDIMKIKKGQDMTFKIPEASDQIFAGKIYLLGTAIEENRTIKVHGHPLNNSYRFLTGMFVNAEIITGFQETVAIPESSVLEFDNEKVILVLDDEKEDIFSFRKMLVEVINTSNGYSFLKENDQLNLTDKILTNGAYGLLIE